ncbi:hypothetical protein K470DRAFT_293555 [Piedraia hortae CBS 480.64]|uniref:Uncharacterized protein n=1 Tax=Piedraia hortae CBS 480.64 TaxID=1314780 RepID=A0A6A7C485_9PEZI|nr:hypothetical protein K470DRAFT_293555 [Piedraia hortae CBS 480.64]
MSLYTDATRLVARSPSWEQQPLPSDAFSHGEPNAFAAQFEEIERALDNLNKSGRWHLPGLVSTGGRNLMPPMMRYDNYGDIRLSSKSASMHELEARPNSAGLQGFYAGQRFPSGRSTEVDQMMQAKRRLAAQRERELRNYHQEQQYNRNGYVPSMANKSMTSLAAASGGQSDGSDSPNALSEDSHRKLMALQHKALYPDTGSLYGEMSSRPQSQDIRTSSTHSPLLYDTFAESTTSPTASSNPQGLSRLTEAQPSARTSISSSERSPPLAPVQKGAVGVAPIGTRPNQGGSISKGAASSSLNNGFNAEKNREPSIKDAGLGLPNWPGNANVWSAAMQPSVWG